MKKLVLSTFILFSLLSCKTQESLLLQYIGYQYRETLNKSFIDKEMLFLKGKDSLIINIKIPFDLSKPEILNQGIFYNCHLKKDSIYTIKLKKICVSDIPDDFNSYYKTNGFFSDKNKCSRFTEIRKDTEYLYKGNYGKYIDINNELYEIIGLSPSDICFFSH
jgi:hypothetical protein